MDKATYEFICDKYADAELALFELRNALKGYDDVDADDVSDMHGILKNMQCSFSDYYGTTN